MTGMPGKGSGARELKVRVKTGKGRKLSSKLWLDRQLNDYDWRKATGNSR